MPAQGQLEVFRAAAALLACVAFVAAISASAQPAEAAMRTCTARLTSTVGKDPTELGAKKKAIDDWVVKAKAAGIKNPAWRLAAERQLKCLPSAGADAKNGFECVAVGHASEIIQVPPGPKPNPSAAPERGFGVDT